MSDCGTCGGQRRGARERLCNLGRFVCVCIDTFVYAYVCVCVCIGVHLCVCILGVWNHSKG